MIEYSSFTLSNGLQVFVHEDHSTPLAVLNLLYNVGSRDEREDKTGFAHLFEHLMFGGSKNVPVFDEPLEKVGGENNAFTSPDITNYYITLPSANIETAFWLESDRMLGLSFDPKILEVQRKVVIEEFKQRYLNQPYGDVWLKLRPLAYKQHPYRWATIGKEISHIEQATMEDVKNFFYRFYIPNNAILVLAGDVTVDQVKRLSEKWFGPIPPGKPYERNLPREPLQEDPRFDEVSATVPADAVHMVYPMPGRNSDQYWPADLLCDALGRGKSSRLYYKLIQERKLFSSVNSYVTGSFDPGLLVIGGKLNENYKAEEGEKAILEVIAELREEGIQEEELQKVKNQSEASHVFGEVELLNRALNLAMGAVQGDPDMTNKEAEKIASVSSSDINSISKDILSEQKRSTLYYRAEKENK